MMDEARRTFRYAPHTATISPPLIRGSKVAFKVTFATIAIERGTFWVNGNHPIGRNL